MVLALLLALSQTAAPTQTLELQPGLSLSLRAEAKLAKEISPLPPNLARAQAWRAGNWLLLINVGKPDGKDCATRMKEENVHAQDALKSKDPNMLALMKFLEAGERKVGKTQAMYSRVKFRSKLQAVKGEAFHDGAGYLICTKKAFVNLSLSISDEAPLSAAQIQELDSIALSLTEK